jgi:phosphoserine phosphatase RsbU/P
MEYLLILLAGLICACGYLAYSLFKEKKRTELVQEHRHQLVKEKQMVLEFIHDISDALVAEATQGVLLRKMITAAVRIVAARSGAIFLADPQREHLAAVAIEGLFPPPIQPADMMEGKLASRSIYLEQVVLAQRVPIESNFLGSVIRSGKSELITGNRKDMGFPEYEEEILKVRSMMLVPLKFREETLGVLVVVNKKGEQEFSSGELSMLESLSEQASFSIYSSRLNNLVREKQRIDRDLEIAHDIQRLLLPDSFPNIAAADVCAMNLPAQEVGGDYYDFIQVDPDHWGFVIADVSGKGVAGALMMTICRSAIRTKAIDNLSPAQVLRDVNRIIFPDIKDDLFITITYGILNSATREFIFARAGHEPVLVCRAETGQIEAVTGKGMAIGIDSGQVFDSLIEDVSLTLRPQDTVLLYTDGITEAIDEHEQEFGRDNLYEAIRTFSKSRNASEVINGLEQRVKRFVGNYPQNDDITLMVVKV